MATLELPRNKKMPLIRQAGSAAEASVDSLPKKAKNNINLP